MYQVYHLTAKPYVARISDGTVLFKVYHILYQIPLNCTTYDYVSRFALLIIYHNLQNVKFKVYHPSVTLLTAIHTLATTEYTHDHFSHAIKKISICYSLSIVFKIYKNKKRGGRYPLEKKNYSISSISSASVMSIYSFLIYRLSPSATGAML